jgi:hypothetical protein
MNWATKRKLQYLGGFTFIFLLIVFIVLYPIIFKKPTCSDGVKNGTEKGIDCGGMCSLMCKESISDPVVLWSRAFPVVGNTFNLVALIENQNKDSAIQEVSYEFRIYDVSNHLIGRRQGTTYVPPNKQLAVFEPTFNPGESELKSVTFQFTTPFVWYKKAPVLNSLPLYVDNIVLGEDKKSPSLSAKINNESIYDMPPFEVVSILYDINHNAINASKTITEGVHSNDSIPVYFTWPKELSSDPVVKDVLVQIDPFILSF